MRRLRTAEGLDAAKKLLADFDEAKRRPGRLQAEHAPSAQQMTDTSRASCFRAHWGQWSHG
jgi:hypothetical protein